MKITKKTIATIVIGSALFITGGLVVPDIISQADTSSTPLDCPEGYHQNVTISPTGAPSYECVADDNTPQTAPENQPAAQSSAPVVAPSPDSATTSNCH